MKKIGVLLCGCGHRDGSEVHEATLTLLAIDAAGAEAVPFGPKGPQVYVRDHFTGEETDESRDMFTESARIARGNIRDIATVTAADFDAVIIPGGQGAALNLSTFLVDGPKTCAVNPEVQRLLLDAHRSKKPIGAICIAPATVAKVFQAGGINAILTLGRDPEMQNALEHMGQTPKDCSPRECVVDKTNRVVSTPAYMTARSIGELNEGISKLVDAVIEML